MNAPWLCSSSCVWCWTQEACKAAFACQVGVSVLRCRPIAHHEVEKKQSALRYVRIETSIALLCSFLINLFIVSVFAKVSIHFTCTSLLHNQCSVCLSVQLSVCLSVRPPVHMYVCRYVGCQQLHAFVLHAPTSYTLPLNVCRGFTGGTYPRTLACSMLGSTWQAILAPAISTYGA